MIYDAVVVGAGHNGLAAAVHLAAKGWKVAVAEGNAEPGGAVKTREVTLPGFRHDLCAMNLSMFAGSAFFRQYKEDLIANGLAFGFTAFTLLKILRGQYREVNWLVYALTLLFVARFIYMSKGA